MGRVDAEKIIRGRLKSGGHTLTEPEAKGLLRSYSIPVPRSRVVKDAIGAVEAAEAIGYPVVLKVVSPDILHKTEAGGVATGISDARELKERLSRMLLKLADERPTADIEGFLVEETASRGVEVIAGVVRDEQFGPLVMFGTGGVAVELMRDVSFRLAPMTKDEAHGMICEVKGYPLLTGFRGDTPKDVDALADVIIRLSGIALEIGEIKEIEINPLIVHENGAVAVDARAVLR
ncbi:MAG: acetate--CoA ligase family protein [Deltaproteobacteria bacterium]|nr:acetate--CoA ligase family protein [Deltaproteobacteria bacterium]